VITSLRLDPIAETLKIAFIGHELELEIFHNFPEEQMVGDVIYERFADHPNYFMVQSLTASLIETSLEAFD